VTFTPALPATTSVVICAYTERRWTDLLDAVRSARDQRGGVGEVIVVIDHNPTLYARARAELPGTTVLENRYARGVSGARNTGIEAAQGAHVAFLDDDAAAEPTWLSELCAHAHGAVGVGGRTLPLWPQSAPRWFPMEFAWVVGASYTGLPEHVADVRNVWTGNMLVARDALNAVGGFDTDFSKVGQVARPEDTELCLRVARIFPTRSWRYVPSARVHHRVPRARATVTYFLRRCFWEGQGKSALAETHGKRTLALERDHALRTLVRGVVRGLRDALRGDFGGAGRAAMITAGLTSTVLGFAQAELARRRLPKPAAQLPPHVPRP